MSQGMSHSLKAWEWSDTPRSLCGSWEPRDDTQVRSLEIFSDQSVSELRRENLQKMSV